MAVFAIIYSISCASALRMCTKNGTFEPVPILTFIRAALDLPEQWNAEVDRDKDEIASTAVQILVDNAEMLEEYFSIGIFITGNNPGRESNRESDVKNRRIHSCASSCAT